MGEIFLYKGLCHVLLQITSNPGVLNYSTLQIFNLLFLLKTCLSLTIWLISLSIMLSSSIHAVAKGISFFFLSAA